MGMIFSKILHDGMIKEIHRLQGETWDLDKKPYAASCRHGIWSRKMHQRYAQPVPERSEVARPATPLKYRDDKNIKEDQEDPIIKDSSQGSKDKKSIKANAGDEVFPPIMKLLELEDTKTSENTEMEPRFPNLNQDSLFNIESPVLDVIGNLFDLSRQKTVVSKAQKRSRVTQSKHYGTKKEQQIGTIQQTAVQCLRDKGTTNLIFKLGPKNETEDLVEIEYNFSRHTNKDVFKTTGSMASLIRELGGEPNLLDSERRSEEQEITTFFQNLELIINKSYGVLEWNGTLILAKDDPQNRLQLTEYELEPTKLYFAVKGLTGLQIIRSSKRLELSGLDDQGINKWFRMKGPTIGAISIQNAENGRLCLTFPDIEH